MKHKTRSIIKGAFVSIWDGNVYIETSCKINLETKEVFDIQTSSYNGDILEKEYVIIDGEEYPVFQLSDITEEDDEFWYDA